MRTDDEDLSSGFGQMKTRSIVRVVKFRGFGVCSLVWSKDCEKEGRLDFFSSNKRKNTFSRAAAGEIFFQLQVCLSQKWCQKGGEKQ
jgi:hypothetical protein